MAERLSREGAKVVGIDQHHDVGSFQVTADLSVESEVEAAYARIYRETGRVDVLYNNAGLVLPEDAIALGPIEPPQLAGVFERLGEGERARRFIQVQLVVRQRSAASTGDRCCLTWALASTGVLYVSAISVGASGGEQVTHG